MGRAHHRRGVRGAQLTRQQRPRPALDGAATTSASPSLAQERRGGVGGVGGFVATACSFVAVFAAGAVAIPLYPSFRAQDGITDRDLSLTAVAYFVCAVSSLLVLARLSDHLGRRPVTLAALGLAAAGCVVLAGVDGPAPLLAGRALQGVAAGLATSAVAAYAVDTAPSRPLWLAAAVTSSGTNVGLAVGAFGSGALVDLAPLPRLVPFALAVACLAVCAVLVAVLAPETAPRSTGWLQVVRGAAGSLRPTLALPPGAGRPMVPAAAVFVATWALGGYYQSFGPSVSTSELGSSSALVAAAVFASYLAPSFVGAPLAGRMSAVSGQRLGLFAVALAAAGLVIAVERSSLALFLGAGALGGLAMGLAMTASLRSLLPHATAAQRAGLLAVVYAVSYTGAALPSLLAGQVVDDVGLPVVTTGYAALTLVCLGVLLVSSTRRARS